MGLTAREVHLRRGRIAFERRVLPPFLKVENPLIRDHVQCVFVHIPKTAGTSVKNAIAAFPNPSPRRYPGLRAHAKAFEYRAALGEERWQRYFSFSFMRNPWDLMVSSYFWWLEKAQAFPRARRVQPDIVAMGDFPTFMRSRWGRLHINEFPGDLNDWVSEDGKVIVDFVGRVENLQDDWRTVCDRLGVPATDLPHLNRTSRGDYRQYYDDATAEIVAARFAPIIEQFGYTF